MLTFTGNRNYPGYPGLFSLNLRFNLSYCSTRITKIKLPHQVLNMQSHFYAYISKIRWLQRWVLKRIIVHENVMEHSWEVATISHALGLIKNRYYDGQLDVNAIVVAAIYHDCSAVIKGVMPSPIKYHSSEGNNIGQ